MILEKLRRYFIFCNLINKSSLSQDGLGFTVVEVLVATGLLSVLALGLAETITQSLRGQNNVRLNASYQGIVSAVSNVLINEKLCRTSIQDSSNTPIRYDGLRNNIDHISLPSGVTIIRSGQVMDGIKITDFYLEPELTPSTLGKGDFGAGVIDIRRRITNLVIVGDKTPASGPSMFLGSPIQTMKIPVTFLVKDGTNEIQHCFRGTGGTGDTSPALYCDLFGGQYSPTDIPNCLIKGLAISDTFPNRNAHLPTDNGFYAKGALKIDDTSALGSTIAGNLDIGVNLLVSGNSMVSGTSTFVGASSFANTVGITGKATLGAGMDVNAGNIDMKSLADRIFTNTADLDPPRTAVNLQYMTDKMKGVGLCAGDGEYSKGIDPLSGKTVCRPTLARETTGDCPSGTYLVGYVASTNSKVCLPVSTIGYCPVGQYMVGVDSSGNRVCNTGGPWPGGCGPGRIVTGIDASGTVQCSSLQSIVGTCGANRFMKGINADGSANCQDIPAINCSPGYIQRIDASGNFVCNTSSTRPVTISALKTMFTSPLIYTDYRSG